MFFLIFLFIILFLSTILILFTSLEIHIINLKFSSVKVQEKHLNKDCKIIVHLNLFDKINLIKIDLMKLKSQKEALVKGIEKIQKKINNEKNKIELKFLKALKYSEIKDFNLKIKISLEDAALNAIFIGILSTILAISLRKIMIKEDNTFWKITPMYLNKNIINVEFDGIFKVKIIHIIREVFSSNTKTQKKFKNLKNVYSNKIIRLKCKKILTKNFILL